MYKVIKLLVYLVFKIVYRFEIINEKLIPEEGPVVLCANHTNLKDPILLLMATKRQVHFMAKKELFENKLVACFLKKMGSFPVDRKNADVQAIKNSLKILKENKVLGIFPEGTRVKEINYDNAKSGTVMIAHKAKALIVPCYIKGDYKIFRKMKIYVKAPMDIRELPKQTTEEYEQISKNLMKTIYEGVEIYKSNTSK